VIIIVVEVPLIEIVVQIQQQNIMPESCAWVIYTAVLQSWAIVTSFAVAPLITDIVVLISLIDMYLLMENIVVIICSVGMAQAPSVIHIAVDRQKADLVVRISANDTTLAIIVVVFSWATRPLADIVTIIVVAQRIIDIVAQMQHCDI